MLLNTIYYNLCSSLFNSILDLSITFNKPIGNGIITAYNINQARQRCDSRNIRKLLFTVRSLVLNINKEYRPSKLTKILNDACNKHPIKNSSNRLIKLKFAKQNKSSDLSISIHGNQTDKIPDSYRKYLVNYFSDQLGLSGVPIKLIFKKEKNPYKMGS